MGVGVMGAEEFDDLESARIHVKVDIAFLEIRRVRRPDPRLGISMLDRRPGCATQASAMFRVDTKKKSSELWCVSPSIVTMAPPTFRPSQRIRRTTAPGGGDGVIEIALGRNRAIRKRPELLDDGHRKGVLQLGLEGLQIVGLGNVERNQDSLRSSLACGPSGNAGRGRGDQPEVADAPRRIDASSAYGNSRSIPAPISCTSSPAGTARANPAACPAQACIRRDRPPSPPPRACLASGRAGPG